MTDFDALNHATADLDPPFAVIDLKAFDANAADMVGRAGGKPIRVASKSVRCRALIERALAMSGFAGVLALSLPEALWLADTVDDVVVGYPSVDRAALRSLAADPVLTSRVTLMVDSVEQLDIIAETVRGIASAPLRVCLDLDASLRIARIHLGPLRSPLHTPEQLAALAKEILARQAFRLVGVMAYEGQIAGVGDNTGSWSRDAQIRVMQALSWKDLRRRRAEAVAAVRALTPLEFVNGGGTGSINETSSEHAITEVAAGSGLYAPKLFDTYRALNLQPAAFFAVSVVRRPSDTVATAQGGGWIASGQVGHDRLPTPVHPAHLSLTKLEGAGEAQTPLTGRGAHDLRVGQRVWFRHSKAGELCEHVTHLHLVEGNEIVDVVPTYRGEGKAF